MKRALVTGAAGFIGANLARRLLDEGHDVLLVVAPGSDTWRLDGVEAAVESVDVADPDAVDALVGRTRADWVFHLAAHGAYSWQSDMRQIARVNVSGTTNLLCAALATGFEAFVNAGSSSEYGFTTAAPTETDAVDPNSVYAATKAGATMLARHLSLAHRVPITTLRLYSAYGPWEDPRRLVPALVLEGFDGRLPSLVDPTTARDFVYVDDVVDAFLRTASSGLAPGMVVNVASGVQTTLADVVAVARSVLELEDEPAWGSHSPRSWDSSCWVGDRSRAGEVLGWEPRYDFEQGFRATVEWAQLVGWPARLLTNETAHVTAGI